MKLQHYLDQLENVKKIGENQYSAKCPNHDDRNNSLTISERNDKILVHCFAGCEFEEIMKHFREETRTWTKHEQNTHSNLGYISLKRQPEKDFIDENDHFGKFIKDHFGPGNYNFDFDSQTGKTQFWYVNKEGRDVNAKCIRFTEAIRRDRNTDPIWKAPFNRLKEKKCWFNEDKIQDNLNIVIVESEKTAVLLQAVIDGLYLEYILKADKPVVISSGGSTGYTNTDYKILKNKRVMILPDNDEPGIRMAAAIKNILEGQGTGCKTLEIDYLQGDKPAGYDIADYITDNIEDKSLLYAYFEMLVETFEDIDLNIDPENNILSFGIFSQISNSIKRQDLVANLLPDRGLASIVGAPDTGKSQFARQLSLCVCCGLEEFLGMELRTDTKKVLYVATEESNETITSGIKKQINGLDLEGFINEINSNLEMLCFTGSDLASLLKSKTGKTKYDLIVIDSFGDIFHSGDISNNTDIRRLLNEYYSITTQQKTLILFIHHITKSSYKQKPEQASVLGGSSYVQKIRVCLDIRNDFSDGNIKYLSITKGNNLSQELKKKSFVLDFDEQTLLFEDTGERIDKDQIPIASAVRSSIRLEEVNWDAVFAGKKFLSSAEIKDDLERLYYMKKTRAYEAMKDAQAKGILKKEGNDRYVVLAGNEGMFDG